MKRRISLIILLSFLISLIPLPALAEGEQLIHQEIMVSYFDIWKGNNWIDTDYDGRPDRPGERKNPSFKYQAPSEILEKYEITRVEIIRPVNEQNYNEAGGRLYDFNGKGLDSPMDWAEFDSFYHAYQAAINGVSAKLVDGQKGEAEVTWDIYLKDNPENSALDLKDANIRNFLGLNEERFSQYSEGWRWFMTGILRWYGIPKTAGPDLYVDSIDPGTSQTEPGKTYRGTVVFVLKENYDKPVKAKLELTHNGNPVPEVNGKIVTFNPGETKEYTFSFTGIDGTDSVIVARIVPIEPDTDVDMSNNEKKVIIPSAGEEEVVIGEGTLVLKAKSPEGYDVWGRWQPSVERPVNTAKYGDTITAYFTAPPPPNPGWDCYRLKEWKLLEAKIVYPKRHPDFTFGWPKPPQGTVTLNMKIDDEENKATASFLEDWSINGSFVYILPEKRMVDGPTYYPVTVQYKMLWEYRKGRKECDENGCRCVDWEDHSRTLSKTVTVKLLVNGTAIGFYGGGS